MYYDYKALFKKKKFLYSATYILSIVIMKVFHYNESVSFVDVFVYTKNITFAFEIIYFVKYEILFIYEM